jgi:hypothetical protein
MRFRASERTRRRHPRAAAEEECSRPPRRRWVRADDGEWVRSLMDGFPADDVFVTALLSTRTGSSSQRRAAWQLLVKVAQAAPLVR